MEESYGAKNFLGVFTRLVQCNAKQNLSYLFYKTYTPTLHRNIPFSILFSTKYILAIRLE